MASQRHQIISFLTRAGTPAGTCFSVDCSCNCARSGHQDTSGSSNWASAHSYNILTHCHLAPAHLNNMVHTCGTMSTNTTARAGLNKEKRQELCVAKHQKSPRECHIRSTSVPLMASCGWELVTCSMAHTESHSTTQASDNWTPMPRVCVRVCVYAASQLLIHEDTEPSV